MNILDHCIGAVSGWERHLRDQWQTGAVAGRPKSVLLVFGLIVFVSCTNGADEGAPPAIGRQGTIARGTIGDSDRVWELSGEVIDGSLCLELLGISCISIPTDDTLEQARLTTSGKGSDGSYTCAFGPVMREVADVRVQFANGVEEKARVVPGQGWATDFYVICVEDDALVKEVRLFDVDGAELKPVG